MASGSRPVGGNLVSRRTVLDERPRLKNADPLGAPGWRGPRLSRRQFPVLLKKGEHIALVDVGRNETFADRSG